MFSLEEKRKIADAVEKILLEIKHPEMPNDRAKFTLHVDGKEDWSWADIKPNWTFGEGSAPTTTEWNESAREKMKNI